MPRECLSCGEEPTQGDSSLCEECESYYEYCGVCKDWVPTDDLCRHLFWSGHAETYLGSGTYEYDWKQCRKSLEVVLNHLGKTRARKLCRALRRRRYFMQFQGPLIGRTWLRCELGGRWVDGKGWGPGRPGCPDEPAKDRFLVGGENIGDAFDPERNEKFAVRRSTHSMAEFLEENRRLERLNEPVHQRVHQRSENMADGVFWLVSLWPGETDEQANLTANWIEAWLAKQPSRARPRSKGNTHAS